MLFSLGIIENKCVLMVIGCVKKRVDKGLRTPCSIIPESRHVGSHPFLHCKAAVERQSGKVHSTQQEIHVGESTNCGNSRRVL